MEWKNFEKFFHKSWHTSMKKWVESKNSAKVYTYLKSRKGHEIAPKPNLTFRTFEQPLDRVRVVVLIEEPYCGKTGDTQFADGIPLSCDYVDKLHSHLREFYDAMEREFYDLNLNAIQNNDLSYLTNQGVLFLSSSLTVEIGSPGAHKDLWVEFNGNLIKNVFCKKDIPIIFCGRKIYKQYRHYVAPVYPYFVIEDSLQDTLLGRKWDTQGKFTQLNEHLDATMKDEIMWVHMDVPF